MLKQRLIFTLYFSDGSFQLSRNFSLQPVGNLNWLRENYDIDSIAYNIDELIIINVDRRNLAYASFAPVLKDVARSYFIPVAAGGNVKTIDDAALLFECNADKIVLGSALYENPSLVESIVRTYGSQAVVAAIDCRLESVGYLAYTHAGQKCTDLSAIEAVQHAQNLGVGEIYLTSIDRDGTGFGYDIDLISSIREVCSVPLIISGGVGKSEHFVAGLGISGVSGASTGNIYNFMGDGLKNARSYIIGQGINLAKWGQPCPTK